MISIRIGLGGDFFLRLNSSIAANMVHSKTAIEQDAADQQSPVALRGIFLGAQHGHIVFADTALKTRQTFPKTWRCRNSIVEDVTLVIIKLIAFGAPAQFPAQKQIPNACGGERRLQVFLVELGGVFRIRLRPRIHHDLNTLRLQQAEKVIHSMVGMPDGEDTGPRG